MPVQIGTRDELMVAMDGAIQPREPARLLVIFRLGGYEFRPAAKLLVDEKGKMIRLTEKETNILKYLYRAGVKAVSREELLAEVWGYNAGVTTHTLETHVYRLRQKIEPDPANARLLLTEQGGYKLAP